MGVVKKMVLLLPQSRQIYVYITNLMTPLLRSYSDIGLRVRMEQIMC